MTLQETICNDDFGRNTVTQKVDAVHADEFLRNFCNSPFLFFFGCLSFLSVVVWKSLGNNRKSAGQKICIVGTKYPLLFDKSKQMASRSRLMNIEEALIEIFADRDSDLGEECPSDNKEDVSKYSDILVVSQKMELKAL